MAAKRERELWEIAAGIKRMIRSYARRVGEADDVDLVDLVELRREFDEAFAAAVRAQNAGGTSWAYIGEALGTSRQSAWERYGRVTDQAS